MQGGGYDPGFHEILCYSPPLHSIKLKTLCWNIWFYKGFGDFMKSDGFRKTKCQEW